MIGFRGSKIFLNYKGELSMKVIQVKYLNATDTLGVRVKATALHWGSKIVGRHYANPYEVDAVRAAQGLIDKVYAGDPEELRPMISTYDSGDPKSGTLPNGDLVFCLRYREGAV